VLILFVHQTEDYHPPPPPPALAADISKTDLVPTGTNPFDKLRGHVVMQALNAALVPWLIAEYGIDFASWDHVDVATEMIAQIITKQQLGQYTLRTFAAIVKGYRVQQTAFTKFVLRQAGNFIFLFPFHLNQQLTSFGQAWQPLSIATICAPF
jgi:hypothetical protein